MITVKRKIDFVREAHGRRRVAAAKPQPAPPAAGRTPRISHLMALAIRLERLLLTGQVSDITELARLGHVTQPRISQILNLAHLAPDIQEALLFLPRVTDGKPSIHERMLRPLVAKTDWDEQRAMWSQINAGE
jgi:hypothetical protein